MNANNTGTATFAILWHMQYQYILKQSYARFQTNLYVYHIYQQNPQKPPTKKKNKMNLKVELKNVLNEKPIKKINKSVSN